MPANTNSLATARPASRGAQGGIIRTNLRLAEWMRANQKMKLNKRERKAQQLLAHYATCERLAHYMGNRNPDGKKISVALLKAERDASNAMTAQCNGTPCNGQPYRPDGMGEFRKEIADRVAKAIGRLPDGFFVNGDPRGYALKIDNETPEGKALIEAVKLHTDWGGYGILSPEITGN